jgi:hypothetical protein
MRKPILSTLVFLTLIGILIFIGKAIINTANTGMQTMAKNGETNCIKGSIARVKPLPQCEKYKSMVQHIEAPNCYSGKTTYPLVKIMQEARDNNCTIN